MRRTAACLVSASLPLLLAGCSLFEKKEPAISDPGLASLEDYSAPIEDTGYEPLAQTEPYTGYPASATETGSAADTALMAGSSAPRYHTVSKGDTLYALARRYYGDQRRWKDIYQANRDKINDPNMVYVGQRLLIP